MLGDLRAGCAVVAARARHVAIDAARIPDYAATLPAAAAAAPPGAAPADASQRERTAAFWLTLAAINFGSGWFPTLRKQPGRSGYDTVAAGLRERFDRFGPWSAAQLGEISAAEVAEVVGQDPEHELVGLFAASLRDLGADLTERYGGSFLEPVREAGSSAVALVDVLAGWACFEDVSHYDDIDLWFLKRAQLATADLARAGVALFTDLERLTMFADNLVPLVLRLDGVLSFDSDLAARIERGELIEHGSAEEVEIRACSVHAVELIVAASHDLTAAGVDQVLWNRGREPRYKAVPRHRSRCTAY